MSVERLQHVSVPRPPGEAADELAVKFYGGVLGLEKTRKPRTFGEIDVSWFRCGETEIHCFATDPGEPRPHTASHFCLVVDDLAATRNILENAGHRCAETTPIEGRPRFMTWVPFGNQIESTVIWAH